MMMSSGKDDDCDGMRELTVAAHFGYDEEGRLARIYDSVSDSNILEWERVTVSDTEAREEIKKRCIFGSPNVDTVTWTVTDAADGNTYSGKADVTVPDGGGSVMVRNWNWWGAPAPPQLVSADVNWTTPDANLGDPYIGNRVILPILRPDGKLAGTLDAKELSICDYSSKGRQGGIVFASNGSKRTELHFYEMNADGGIAAMLTLDEYGSAIIGFGPGGGQLYRYNFFQAWPSKWKGWDLDAPAPEEPVVSRYRYYEAWPARWKIIMKSAPPGGGTRDAWNWTNNPDRFNFFEAWPSSWGPQPYLPIYSETGDGTMYIAGAVTPGGAYCYFQYSSSGEYDIEAMIRMNSVDAVTCTDDIPGDLNGDCTLDLRDFGLMAQRWLECNLEYEDLCQ